MATASHMGIDTWISLELLGPESSPSDCVSTCKPRETCALGWITKVQSVHRNAVKQRNTKIQLTLEFVN